MGSAGSLRRGKTGERDDELREQRNGLADRDFDPSVSDDSGAGDHVAAEDYESVEGQVVEVVELDRKIHVKKRS